MDLDLRKLIAERVDDKGQATMSAGPSGWLDEITVGTGEKAAAYRLKPLAELYGAGTGVEAMDPRNKVFQPLLHGIESQILRFDVAQHGRLTDGQVSLALGKLAMSPEADAGTDVLANRIQIGLRLALSLGNYSRQEVKQALRRIAKSAEMHTKQSGARGYLNFVRKHVHA